MQQMVFRDISTPVNAYGPCLLVADCKRVIPEMLLSDVGVLAGGWKRFQGQPKSSLVPSKEIGLMQNSESGGRRYSSIFFINSSVI